MRSVEAEKTRCFAGRPVCSRLPIDACQTGRKISMNQPTERAIKTF